LTFESASKLTRIESKAFLGCRALKSICLPSSLQFIGLQCFDGSSISSLTFESDSTLTRIDSKAFCGCRALKSICVPSSVEVLCTECFRGYSVCAMVSFSWLIIRAEPYNFMLCVICYVIQQGWWRMNVISPGQRCSAIPYRTIAAIACNIISAGADLRYS
jgi:hypothetical protein